MRRAATPKKTATKRRPAKSRGRTPLANPYAKRAKGDLRAIVAKNTARGTYTVRFGQKPPAALRKQLGEAGFKWAPKYQLWHGAADDPAVAALAQKLRRKAWP